MAVATRPSCAAYDHGHQNKSCRPTAWNHLAVCDQFGPFPPAGPPAVCLLLSEFCDMQAIGLHHTSAAHTAVRAQDNHNFRPAQFLKSWLDIHMCRF